MRVLSVMRSRMGIVEGTSASFVGDTHINIDDIRDAELDVHSLNVDSVKEMLRSLDSCKVKSLDSVQTDAFELTLYMSNRKRHSFFLSNDGYSLSDGPNSYRNGKYLAGMLQFMGTVTFDTLRAIEDDSKSFIRK